MGFRRINVGVGSIVPKITTGEAVDKWHPERLERWVHDDTNNDNFDLMPYESDVHHRNFIKEERKFKPRFFLTGASLLRETYVQQTAIPYAGDPSGDSLVITSERENWSREQRHYSRLATAAQATGEKMVGGIAYAATHKVRMAAAAAVLAVGSCMATYDTVELTPKRAEEARNLVAKHVLRQGLGEQFEERFVNGEAVELAWLGDGFNTSGLELEVLGNDCLAQTGYNFQEGATPKLDPETGVYTVRNGDDQLTFTTAGGVLKPASDDPSTAATLADQGCPEGIRYKIGDKTFKLPLDAVATQ